MNSGIYLIRNLLNGESYIGASCDLAARLANHRRVILRHKPSFGHDYRRAFLNVRNEWDVEFRVLEFIDSDGHRSAKDFPAMLEREKHWIQKLSPTLNTHHKRQPIDVSKMPIGEPDAVPKLARALDLEPMALMKLIAPGQPAEAGAK